METIDRKRILIIVIALAVLALFGYAFWKNSAAEPQVYTGPHAELNTRADAVESYIRANLTTLSPVEATMGGTFYVTRIRLLEGTGTVNYEDGHMAYVGTFTYTVSEDNKTVEVTSFEAREATPEDQ